MNTSLTVPTKPTDGEYITATKAAGTAYDDIAVEGLQVYGNQTTAGNTGAAAYITGSNGNLIIAAQDSVYISSLFVSSLTATNVVSTTATTGTSLTLTTFLSSASVFTSNLSTNSISTSQIVSKDIFTSTLTVSTLNAPNFVASTLSTVVIDTKVTLTSTLSLTGSPTNINLGLGDVIQGLVGGAATQALGAGLGGAGLITGAAALLTGRTSGGVNSNIFQTVNGSTQLQFSTIGSNVSSVFLTVNSPDPLTTPGLEISTTQGVAAGTYCVRSVGDPLYITNNVSSIQMLGEWVPVIQPTATIPVVAISSLTVSSINGLPPGGGGGITSTVALSTATVSGNLSSIGAGTFSWGGNTISPVQAIYNVPTSFNNTLTTTSGTFLNGGATVNGPNLLVGALTPLIVNNTARINNLSTVLISTANINVSTVNNLAYPPPSGTPTIPSSIFLSTVSVNGGQSITNGGLAVAGGTNLFGGLNASGGTTVFNGLNVASGGATIQNGLIVPTGNVTVNNSLFAFQILQGQTVQATGSLSVGFGGISIVGGGISMATGNLNMTNGSSVANITNVNVGQNLVANQLVRANAISTNQISTNNINLVTINNQSYPPPAPPSQIPSTINASTINFDGGLNNTGSAPIITGTITTTNANVNFYNGNAITAASISTNTISTNNITVNTINGVPYVPAGGGGIASTLNASTINVNGGINISNGGIINNSFEPIRSEFLSTVFISTGTITADTMRSDFLSTAMIRAAGVSTNFLSTQTVRADAVSTNSLSTQTVRAGAVSTNFLSTQTVTAGNISSVFVSTGTITANIIGTFNFSTIRGSINGASISSLSTNEISTNSLLANNGNISSLVLSSINGVQIPGNLGVPIGSITIWAGGADNGFSSQNFNIPSGWLLCDGSFILNSVFPTLASVLGNKYGYPGQGPPPGLTALPDLTFAVPMGTPYRNYTLTNIPSVPTINLQAQTSDSAYNTTSLAPGGTQISSLTTWYITSKIGPVLNYGTVFPGNSITVAGSSITFPSVYISSIIIYEGAANDTGFILLRSVDGTSPIPRVPITSTILAVGQGVAGTLPGGADTPYFLGSANVEGRSQVTRNQKGIEVGSHTHQGVPDTTSSAIPGSGFSVGNGGFTNANFQPYVSTPANRARNVGTYTAPNFLNMTYIIRGL